MMKTSKDGVVPDEIGGAKVLHFIKIKDALRRTGNTQQIVEGVLMGPAYGLAICKYDNEIGYYLFGCDENWNSITDTYHDTIEDAMEQGEFEYEGITGMWRTKQSSQPSPDTAVFTTKFVIEDKKTITYVIHAVEDGAWQFFSDDKFDNFESVARIVGLREIVDMDPTLTGLIDMEVGHVATRNNKDDKWTIKRAK